MTLTKLVNPHCHSLQRQEKVNWCWAATAANVGACHAVKTTQCDIASLCLTTCGNGCFGASCDIPHFLKRALEKTNRFKSWAPQKLHRADFVNEINAGRPVGARIQWRGSSDGHFILLVGYGRKKQVPNKFYYLVFDSNVGLQALEGQSMERENGYQVVGTWCESFLTL